MFRQSKTVLQKLRYLSFQGLNPSWRFRSTSATERALQYQAGQKIHGFTVKEVVAVPDLFLTAVKLTHDNTDAQYLHAARDDKNNLFRFSFSCPNTFAVFSSGRPRWTIQGFHTSWNTQCCVAQRNTPAETPSLTCSTDHSLPS
ncbi:unnamed protein product [Coregonus sp. 'balchen']|nr:unnamed protein product [Coregonus sp. 'balchen']